MTERSIPITGEYTRPHHSLWGDAFIRLRRNKLAVAGAVLILLVALGAIIVPFVSPYTFDGQDLKAIMQGPNSHHWLGTDELGRDVLTRLLFGARTSLLVGIFTQVIILAIGIPVGAFAGSMGGRTDNYLMRFVDVMYAFPDILLVILLRQILGGSIYMIFLAIGLVAWVNVARLIRASALAAGVVSSSAGIGPTGLTDQERAAAAATRISLSRIRCSALSTSGKR